MEGVLVAVVILVPVRKPGKGKLRRHAPENLLCAHALAYINAALLRLEQCPLVLRHLIRLRRNNGNGRVVHYRPHKLCVRDFRLRLLNLAPCGGLGDVIHFFRIVIGSGAAVLTLVLFSRLHNQDGAVPLLPFHIGSLIPPVAVIANLLRLRLLRHNQQGVVGGVAVKAALHVKVLFKRLPVRGHRRRHLL